MSSSFQLLFWWTKTGTLADLNCAWLCGQPCFLERKWTWFPQGRRELVQFCHF